MSSATIPSALLGPSSAWVWHDERVLGFLYIVVGVVGDLIAWVGLALRPRKSLEAEILFLHRQLAQYVERGANPRRIDPVTRVFLAGRFGGGASRDPDALAPCGYMIAGARGRRILRPLK